MKVVLFYPRGYENAGDAGRIATLAVSLPPISLASCAAVLRKGGHDVVVFDAACHFSVANAVWVQRILAEHPDVVGFSTITSNFLDAYEVCHSVKDARGDIRTVFGGVHVSWGKGTLLARYPAIDYIVAGEGEFALLDLANDKAPSTIAGLWYRDGDDVLYGPVQDKHSLCTMDDLPFPAYDLVDGFPGKYAPALFSYPRFPGASVISSRGCVYHCDYCDRSVFRTSFRWQSPEYTLELITLLARNFGVRHIMFYDDLFTLHRDRVARLCRLLRDSKLGISFNCIVRTGHIDRELIAELKTAGCWMVHLGIESGDQAMLDLFKEGLTLSAIKQDVEALHGAGLWVKGLFMMGFPGETETSVKKTIAFAASLPLKDANITAFTPFPGAPVAEHILEYGSFDTSPDNWVKMDCVNFVFVPHSIGSREALERYYKDFIRTFYRRPFMRKVYRKMFVQSPHSYWRLLKNAPSFFRYAANMKKVNVKN